MSGLLHAWKGFSSPARWLLFVELAERASYYGYRALLTIFLTSAAFMLGESNFSEAEASAITRGNIALAYVLPVIGGLLADWFLGRYMTLVIFATICTLGHGLLSLSLHYEEWSFLANIFGSGLATFQAGLFCIAVGAGGLKPNSSGLFGDTFTGAREQLLEQGYKWFYFSINVGSLLSFIFVPLVRVKAGYDWAFGIPGILMAIATIAVIINRKSLPHNKPTGYQKHNWLSLNLRAIGMRLRGLSAPWEQLAKAHPTATQGALTVGKVGWFFAFFMVAWAAFDCQGSEFSLDAKYMDRSFFGMTIPVESMQVLNTFFVLLLIPFSLWFFDFLKRRNGYNPSVQRKVLIGMLLLGIGLTIEALARYQIEAALAISPQELLGNGQEYNTGVSGVYQVFSYFFVTAGEVLFSIGGLELGYRLGPPAMKATILSVFYLSTAGGNLMMKYFNNFREEGRVLDFVSTADLYLVVVVALLINAGLFHRYLKSPKQEALFPNSQ